jgi:hypothetical protein
MVELGANRLRTTGLSGTAWRCNGLDLTDFLLELGDLGGTWPGVKDGRTSHQRQHG